MSIIDLEQVKRASAYEAKRGKEKSLEEVVAHELGHAMGKAMNRGSRYFLDKHEASGFSSYFACQEQKKAHMLQYGDVAEGERTWSGCSHWGF